MLWKNFSSLDHWSNTRMRKNTFEKGGWLHDWCFFFFWASSSIPCLAVLDFGAGVEQPFGCLIVHNRQAMQSMRRSVDWTLVDGSSAPHSQAAEETMPHLYKHKQKHPTLVQRPDPGSSWESHSGRVGASVGDEIAESCGAVRPFRNPLVIRPVHHTYVVRWTDELLCEGVQMGVSIWCAVHLHLMEWVSAEWSRCPGSMARCTRESVALLRRSSSGWMPATKLSRKDWKVVRWCRT